MDTIRRFLDHLRDERGLSPRTREAYARDLEKFADEVGRIDAAMDHVDILHRDPWTQAGYVSPVVVRDRHNAGGVLQFPAHVSLVTAE